MAGRGCVAAASLAIAATSACGSGDRCGTPPPLPQAASSGASGSALAIHAIENGGTLLDALVAAPLTREALSKNAAFVSALRDPSTRSLFQHMVECALPQGASIVVRVDTEDVELDGSAGYAPEWADGPCDVACQEWVTSCLLARVNYWGVHVVVDLRSTNAVDASPSADDLRRFPVEEGAFFGNFFTFPQKLYACRGRGFDPLSMTMRVCTDGAFPCGIMVVGTCSTFDGATGAATDSFVCEDVDDAFGGAYRSCHDRTSTSSAFASSDVYDRVVTVHLKATSFSAPQLQEHCP